MKRLDDPPRLNLHSVPESRVDGDDAIASHIDEDSDRSHT